MPFEKFERQYRRFSRPAATIHTTGVLTLNNEARALLGAVKRLWLFYDSSTERLGLQKAPDNDINAYRGEKAQISIHALLNRYNIDYSYLATYPADLEGDMLVIDLKSPIKQSRRDLP